MTTSSRLRLFLALVSGFVFTSFAEEARWIWYPGDYGLWWGNELQSQRLQWGSRLTPFWPMYAPETRVLFRKDGLELKADEPLTVSSDGHTAFCWTDDKGVYRESAVIGGRILLPKNAKKIEVKIQNTFRPPAIWVKGPTLVSDASWKVSWDGMEEFPVDSSARFIASELPIVSPSGRTCPTITTFCAFVNVCLNKFQSRVGVSFIEISL